MLCVGFGSHTFRRPASWHIAEHSWSFIELHLIEDPHLHERRHEGLGLCVLDLRLQAVQQRLVHAQRLRTIGAIALLA